MKKDLLWKILLAIGICPFIIPFVSFLWRLVISESWTLLDWLVMYSFIFWPTYIVGIILIVISATKLKKSIK